MLGASQKSTRRNNSILVSRKPVPTIVWEVRKPECTDFGPNGKTNWLEYFFCSNCKLYEDELVTHPHLEQGSAKKKYLCQGGLNSFDHPTTKQKEWCRSVEEIDLEREEQSAKNTVGRPKKRAKLLGVSV